MSVTNISTTYTAPANTIPDVGDDYYDPMFGSVVSTGSNVTRVVSADALGQAITVPTYSNLQAWNADGTYVLVTRDSGYYVLNASTWAVYRSITSAYVSARWSPTDPNLIYYIEDDSNIFGVYDISDNSYDTLHTFTEYTTLNKDMSCQELSRDGNYVALVGTKVSGGRYEICVYKIDTDQKISQIDTTGSDYNDLSWAMITPKGDYVLILWAALGNNVANKEGLKAYNAADMSYAGHVWGGREHGDICLMDDGVQYWVTDNHQGYNLDNPVCVCVSSIPTGSTQRKLVKINTNSGTEFGIHVSCRNTRLHGQANGWCVISSEAERDVYVSGFIPFCDEVFKVYFDSTVAVPHVERLCHTQSDTYPISGNYWNQPHATVNRDGTRILFGSNWRVWSGHRDTYQIDLTKCSSSTPIYDQTPDNYWRNISATVNASHTSGILEALSYSGLCIDTANDRIIRFGGGHHCYMRNEVMVLNPTTKVWTQQYAGVLPPGSAVNEYNDPPTNLYPSVCHRTWEDGNDTYEGRVPPFYANELYDYTVPAQPRPWSRHSYDMLECDDAGNVMLIDGVQRTWLYTIAGGWNLRHGQAGHTPLPGAGYYMSTQAGCLCFVPTTDEFIYLGGATYAYKISTDDWVTVAGLGGATAFHSCVVWDPDREVVWNFAGDTGSGYGVNNLYKFNPVTRVWTQVTPVGTSPSRRRANGLAYDTLNHVLVAFFGEHRDSGDATWTGLTEVWIYNPVMNEWFQPNTARQVTTPTTSEPNDGGGRFLQGNFVYDPSRNLFFWTNTDTYAGGFSTGTAGSTWVYRYRSNGIFTTEEGTPPAAPTSLRIVR